MHCNPGLTVSRHYPQELYLRSQMPKSVDWTLKRLYPASSLLQSPCNVRLSWFVNQAGHFPENSQWVNGIVDDISILWPARKQSIQTSESQKGSSQHTFYVTSCLLHVLPRHHPTSPNPNGVFPVGKNASDMDNLQLCEGAVTQYNTIHFNYI